METKTSVTFSNSNAIVSVTGFTGLIPSKVAEPASKPRLYFRVNNFSEKHRDIQYHDGRNFLIQPFNNNPNETCCAGGLYFSDEKSIWGFMEGEAFWIRPVTLPPTTDTSFMMVTDPRGDKYRANFFNLGTRYSLFDVNTFKMLADLGCHFPNGYEAHYYRYLSSHAYYLDNVNELAYILAYHSNIFDSREVSDIITKQAVVNRLSILNHTITDSRDRMFETNQQLSRNLDTTRAERNRYKNYSYWLFGGLLTSLALHVARRH
jgi:hypothetical protein